MECAKTINPVDCLQKVNMSSSIKLASALVPLVGVSHIVPIQQSLTCPCWWQTTITAQPFSAKIVLGLTLWACKSPAPLHIYFTLIKCTWELLTIKTIKAFLMISFLPWLNSSSSSRWTWIYMHWTTAWSVNCGCLSRKHSASIFRWYDPLRSRPLHITVLWKSHLYSSRRSGMLWCLSAEKRTRLPSNAAMTHTDRQSARTTRALSVRDWPWLHIWKTHSKQNRVLVLRWPPNYPVIWDWFPF